MDDAAKGEAIIDLAWAGRHCSWIAVGCIRNQLAARAFPLRHGGVQQRRKAQPCLQQLHRDHGPCAPGVFASQILVGALRQRAVGDGDRLPVAIVHPIDRGSGGEAGDCGGADGVIEPPRERGFVRPRRIPHEFAIPDMVQIAPVSAIEDS